MITKLSRKQEQLGVDGGLLALRLAFGGLMLVHGIPKLLSFGMYASKFPDPLGVGSQISLVLAIFSEVVCSVLLMAGVLTRFAASQLIITMGVAAFIVHSADPFAKKELALVYLLGYLALLLTGGGRFSVDRKLFRQNESISQEK